MGQRTPAGGADAAPVAGARTDLVRGLWDSAGMLGVFAVVFVLLSAFVPYFITWRNMVGLMLSVALVGLVACTMLFCLASGDFDLSVESILALSGVLAAVIVSDLAHRLGPVPAVLLGGLAGIASGALVGLVNGFVIARLRVNALITTLATLQVVRGAAYIIAKGKVVGVSTSAFFVLGSSRPLGVPAPVWLAIASFVVFGVLLHRTAFGRQTLAIGGNRESARLSGISVSRVKIVIFTMQGAMAGLAGVILASEFTNGDPGTSAGFSLDVISACVLGGVSLSGGIGTIFGVVAGVLLMGTVQNAMNLLNTPAFYQYVARGGILLLAVLFDQLRQRRR